MNSTCRCGSTKIQLKTNIGFESDNTHERRIHQEICLDCGSIRGISETVVYNPVNGQPAETTQYGPWQKI